jgi:AcrR family transcriptional regulator/DNA-binding MarR family transcriptional regulator
VLEIQRSRLLAGALAAIEQQGYSAVMVSHITAGAKVSRRTFYELFENRETCLAALFEDILGMIEAELVHSGLEGLPWRERVRGGLWVILSFFDREPALARMCVVHALRGAWGVQALREQVFTRLVGVVDEGRDTGSRAADCSDLTAEGLVGAAFGIVYARLVREQQGPLTGLLGELMGMIVLPYQGPAAARAERARGVPCAPAPRVRSSALSALALSDCDPLQALPMRVTYRTARVLESIERQPGVSNREVADEAGIKDPGQISKLLARLGRLGLVENAGEGAQAKGEPNVWQLTALGQQVAQRLRISPESGSHLTHTTGR